MTGERSCDASSALVFVIGLVSGTVCIIASKSLCEGTARGSDGEVEPFHPPVWTSFIMFFGMVFALPLYLILEGVKRVRARSNQAIAAELAAAPEVTLKMVLNLGVPAVFDLSSVLLLMAGLMHIPASMWSLLRGGCIVFVALMKQFGLGTPLSASMWVGVGVITCAVCLVGLSPMLNDEAPTAADADGAGEGNVMLTGVLLTVGGTFMQSVQYAYEEKMLTGETPAPPWLLIGMEGVFGSLLTFFLVYPIAAVVPGPNNGVFEDLDNTMAQLRDNPTLVGLSVLFCVSVFALNSMSILVTFMLSSVWHAILDNFRPISIWATQLAIYSLTDGAHGEAWTRASYAQLAGLVVMLLGTAIYNGTIAVPGLPTKDLLAKSDAKSTPALTRSPLLTQNAQPGLEFGSGSPYAQQRVAIDNSSLTEQLVGVGVNK